MFDNCFAIRTVAFLDALKSKVTFFSYLDKFLPISLFYPLLLKKYGNLIKKRYILFLKYGMMSIRKIDKEAVKNEETQCCHHWLRTKRL